MESDGETDINSRNKFQKKKPNKTFTLLKNEITIRVRSTKSKRTPEKGLTDKEADTQRPADLLLEARPDYTDTKTAAWKLLARLQTAAFHREPHVILVQMVSTAPPPS